MLRDDAALWTRASSLLAAQVRIVDEDAGPEVIGLVSWGQASREEIAQLPALRAVHAGPLVALVADTPSVRGARALAARLEGTVLAAEVADTLVPTLVAVRAGQCVMPRSIRQLLERRDRPQARRHREQRQEPPHVRLRQARRELA
jgi:DNA-binding NarL/FixJ family response regulator